MLCLNLCQSYSSKSRLCKSFINPLKHKRIRRILQNTKVMSTISKQELLGLPGVTAQPDEATRGYILQQTMLRVKDAKVALDFYTRVLGMTLMARLDYNDMKFSLYFLGYCDPSDIPEDPVERARWMFGVPGCLELTHNHGTENDPDFSYHSGNSDPKGFGHIGITVPSVAAACKRFEDLDVEFVKKPLEGKMKNLAFIKDPDGYWIEVLEAGNAEQLVHWPGNAFPEPAGALD